MTVLGLGAGFGLYVLPQFPQGMAVVFWQIYAFVRYLRKNPALLIPGFSAECVSSDLICCAGWARTSDLLGMSQTSQPTALPRMANVMFFGLLQNLLVRKA